MIFATLGKQDETPAILCILTEHSLQTIRQGRTVYVDQRQLQGTVFDRVIIGYAKTDVEAMEVIKLGGSIHEAHKAPVPDPTITEGRCKKCNGTMPKEILFEEQCTMCWAAEAKSLRTRLN